MSEKRLTRRDLLRSAFVGSAGLMLAACQPKIVEVTKIVKEEVEKIVKETVVVKEAVEVEKEVTRVVEEIVEKEVEKVVKETVVVEVAKKEPVTIQVWSCYVNPTRSEPFAVQKKKWAETNADIIINETPMAGSQAEQRQKIAAAVAAGIPPDLWNNTSPRTWGQRGMVVPINAFAEVKGNWDPDDWVPAMINHYTDQATGVLYGFQQESDDRALYWRKDLFAEAGLDPEKPPTTFSEHRDVAQKLTVKKGDFYDRLGFHPTYGQAWIWGYIGEAGGYPVLDWSVSPPQWHLNSPQAVTALQHMVDFADDYGGVSILQTFKEGFQSGADEPFFTGQLAMMINGSWMLQRFERYVPDMEFGVAHEPIADNGGKKATLSGGWGWAIPVGSLHAPEAFDFMSWLVEFDQMKFWCETCSYIPSKRSVGKDPVFRKGKMAFFTEAMSWSITWPGGPWTRSPGYTLGNAQDDAMLHNKTVQEALNMAQKEYQEVADEYYG